MCQSLIINCYHRMFLNNLMLCRGMANTTTCISTYLCVVIFCLSSDKNSIPVFYSLGGMEQYLHIIFMWFFFPRLAFKTLKATPTTLVSCYAWYKAIIGSNVYNVCMYVCVPVTIHSLSLALCSSRKISQRIFGAISFLFKAFVSYLNCLLHYID